MASKDSEIVCISSDSESEEVILILDSDADNDSVPRKDETERSWKDSQRGSSWKHSDEIFEAELQLALEVSLQEYQEKNPQPSTSGEHGAKKAPMEDAQQNLQKEQGSRLKGKSKFQKSWSRYKAEKQQEKSIPETPITDHVTNVSIEMNRLNLEKSDGSDEAGYAVPRKKARLDIKSTEKEVDSSGELICKSFRSSQRIYDCDADNDCAGTSTSNGLRSSPLSEGSSLSSSVTKPRQRTLKKLTFVKVECLSESEGELSDSLPDLEEPDQDFGTPSQLELKPPPPSVGPVYSDVSSDDDTQEKNIFHSLHQAVYSDISEDDRKVPHNNAAYSDISSDDDLASSSHSGLLGSGESSPQDRHFLDIFTPTKKIKLDSPENVNNSSNMDLTSPLTDPIKTDCIENFRASSRERSSSLESVVLYKAEETGLTVGRTTPQMEGQKENRCPSSLKGQDVDCENIIRPCSVMLEDKLKRLEEKQLIGTKLSRQGDTHESTARSLTLNEVKSPLKRVTSAPITPEKLTWNRRSRKVKSSPRTVQSDMRKFLQASPKKAPMSLFNPAENRKILHHAFLSDFALPRETAAVDPEAVEFSATQGCTIDACMEEGGRFMDHVLDLVQGFALYNMPSETVVQYIYNFGLVQSVCISQSHKAFNILSYIQRKYPHAVKVDWHMVSTLVENLGLNKASQTADKCTIVNSTLALQLLLQVLHGDLQHRDLSDSKVIRGSLAYKVLLSDHQFNRLKKVMDWINCVLTCGEYEEVRESYVTLHLKDMTDAPQRGLQQDPARAGQVEPALQELKTVLPFLQQLLEMGILVSDSNIDCAKRLATEFVRILYYLPNLEHKKLLLQTMSSDLLRFKVCQFFLEAHCDSPQCCEDFPRSLLDVLECFQAVPPKSHLTPPLTPSEDDRDGINYIHMIHVSPQSCEQLVMIQYYVLYSYIKSSKGQSYKALRRRAKSSDVQLELSHEDKLLLRDDWENRIESLRLTILELAGDVTPITQRYLCMLLCLGLDA